MGISGASFGASPYSSFKEYGDYRNYAGSRKDAIQGNNPDARNPLRAQGQPQEPRLPQGQPGAAANPMEDPAIQQAVAELQQIEREVIAHEQAHMSAGAHLAGTASYSYTKGPDGKEYITGGEVPIKMPTGKDAEETIRLMDQVIRAALAPANPSPQDLSVASQAAMKQMQARAEAARASAAAVSPGTPTPPGTHLDITI